MIDNEKILILLGKAGCGKGTQSDLLKEKYNLFHISTGDIIRENIQNDTSLGRQFKSYSDSGKLVPNQLINSLVLDKVFNVRKSGKYNGFIFDGFPRTADQMEFLITSILTKNTDSYILDYALSDEEAKVRIKGRAQKMGDKARKDDLDDNSINTRFAEYNKNYSAIIKFAKKFFKIINYVAIDARDSMEDVFEETKKCIGSKSYLKFIHDKNIEASNSVSSSTKHI